MVPGMQHCTGGPGATSFGNDELALKPEPDDADHDILLALDRWVTQGVAPDKTYRQREESEPMPRPGLKGYH